MNNHSHAHFFMFALSIPLICRVPFRCPDQNQLCRPSPDSYSKLSAVLEIPPIPLKPSVRCTVIQTAEGAWAASPGGGSAQLRDLLLACSSTALGQVTQHPYQVSVDLTSNNYDGANGISRRTPGAPAPPSLEANVQKNRSNIQYKAWPRRRF
jgi:hypothetical protein